MASVTQAPTGYSRTHIILHWVIAALVLFQLFASDGIEAAWRARSGAPVDGGNPLPHIVVGSAILILAAWRIILRIRNGAPAHPAGQPPLLTFLASAVHWLFYALLFMLPISGLVGWFGNVDGAANAHVLMQSLFLPLIGLHVIGALVQQFWFKNHLIRRMMVPR